MATLDVINLEKQKVGTIDLPDDIVNAEIAHITYSEFLPHLIGPDALGAYSGYDPSVDPRITLEFAECLGACEHAPCILANNDLHKSVSQSEADQLVKSLP